MAPDSKPAAKTPPTHCRECKPPVKLELVKSSDKQVDQVCPKCKLQHITGLPASTYSTHREG